MNGDIVHVCEHYSMLSLVNTLFFLLLHLILVEAKMLQYIMWVLLGSRTGSPSGELV